MKKLYEKNELTFALIWIGVYVVLLGLADNISAILDFEKIITAPLCIVMTGILYLWLRKNGLMEKYGLCAFQGSAKQYLYFIPLILIAPIDLWWGIELNLSVAETLLYIVSMLCVGFLEEVIFRGFLFKALCKENVKWAIVISSVTFGIGHIVNLLNGADFVPTLLQVCYAIAAGFLFTILFYKGKSLWPCILTHSAINSLSVFADEKGAELHLQIITAAFLCVVSLAYALYLVKRIRTEQE